MASAAFLAGLGVGYVVVGLTALAAILAIRRAGKGEPVARDSPLLDQAIDLAMMSGWLVHHGRPSRTGSGGWATAVKGHTGFPDLVMVHPRRAIMVAVEVKPDGGYPNPEQRAWIAGVEAVVAALADGGAHGHLVTGVWRPRDWPAIRELIRPSSRPGAAL